MALRLDIRSFYFIAAAALLLAALLGFVLGLMGGGVDVAPTIPDTQDLSELPAAPGDYDQIDDIPPRQADPPARTGPSREPSRPGPVHRAAPGPDVGAAPARQLADGRVDEMVQAASIQSADAQIQVTLTDDSGNRIRQPWVALDIKAGPLGWQVHSGMAEIVRGESGVFVFRGLYPGEYRARTTSVNHSPAEQPVTVHTGSGTEQVTLVLQRTMPVVLEITPRFADGEKPESVQVMTDRTDPQVTQPGRFGDHRVQGAFDRPPVRPVAYWTTLGPEGVLRLDLVSGIPVTVTLSAFRDNANWAWSERMTPQSQGQRIDAVLQRVDDDGNEFPDQSGVGRVDVAITFTVDGSASHQFTHVTLRRRLEDAAYTTPTSAEGNKFTWRSLAAGTYFVVAQVQGMHARFVGSVDVTRGVEHSFDIRTGKLRVVAQREQGSPDPDGKPARYRVKFKPRGHGTVENSFMGELTGQNSDTQDFLLPEGEYEVQVESGDLGAPVAAEPVSQKLRMAAGGSESLSFVLRAASTLTFRCVDINGVPYAGAEFLLTFHAAGSVPASEQANVRKAGADGVCRFESAPYGSSYLMIWAGSGEWDSPDRVFKIDLPAYSGKDLGNIVVAP